MGLLSNITTSLQQYVVAPLASFGVAGFVFNAQGESVAHLSADITDHFAEDNKAIQDHIAIRPKRIVLKGYVGELVYNSAEGQPTALQTLAQKLTTISAFLPPITAAATQAQEILTNPGTASFASVLGASSNIYGIVKNVLAATGNTKNQQNAYNYFKALMESATLMGVQTPWEFMTSMAIESITAIQGENSIYISDFSVTLKQLRIASTTSTAFSNPAKQLATTASTSPAGSITMVDLPPPSLQAIAAAQAAPPTNLGLLQGVSTPLTVSNLLPK